ncbi:MAG: hypothetical protein Q9224_003822 [Gallowayella concinna]
MPGYFMYFRSLGALLFLFITALFLSKAAINRQNLIDQPPSDIDNDTTDFTKTNAIPSGGQHPIFGTFSHLHYHHQAPLKRTLSEPFQCLIEKGQQYWETGVKPAFDGQSRFPTPNFGAAEDPLEDSGWTSYTDHKPLPKWWMDAFKAMPGKTLKADVPEIYLDQSNDFENDHGEQKATSAQYYAQYIPQSAAIVVILAISPRFKVSQRRVPPEKVPKHVPRMNQLSDLLWYTWEGETNHHPESLRYYAVEGIRNTVAKDLILEIFHSRRGTTDVPWAKRITFDLTSDEGKALFGSPNGIAVNWLLIHHAQVLGRREPRVTIFNAGNKDRGDNVCMIWDLIPKGKKGSFGKVEKEPKPKKGKGGPQTKSAG